MWGVLPASDQRFTEVVHAPSLLPRGPFLITMATCHSLTKIKGQISGDPLDLKMFEVTDWELDEPGEEDTSKFDTFAPTVVRPRHPDVVRDSSLEINEPGDTPYEVGIVRQFTFSSSLQRMSVIARTLGERNFCLYAKGAPETIASLCKVETIPVDFHDKLLEYTQHGCRVLALAWKPLHAKVSYVKTQRITRWELCGFVRT
ncbi:probable cation-transporting ATPase 13A3 [Lingula anatina]|uniref:Probable cation-transporting ATPase 13A3 n=1 Tax=Lingula anatina TaxID=7574 RepID=A0A1S3H3D5_LINAN|nr:probable cation-transporting ATPase 13A3 [Lingula anatina]|eukprot:XP_013379991.1 probable cation-transporting ATPase 13A3 [Lingula anatina]